MKHYGDVSKINGSEIEPVDIITFGSPCQDMSVAGKREGMKHSEQGDEKTTRSGLFYEAVRIIEEMRKATNGEYPKYAVWENVHGAFSSNKGRDFHAVLEALCSVCDSAVSIPKPYDSKRTKLVWNKAGEIVGDDYSVAWRTLDAQYWGVPQRRKRIYLVADFTGRCAGEILFKPDSLRGDLQQGNETGQEVAADAVGGADGSVRAAGVVSKGNGDCFIIPEKHMLLSIGGGQAGQGYPCAVYSFDSLSSNSMKSANPISGCRAVVDVLPFNTTQITSPQNGNNPKWGDPCHCLASTDHPPAAVIALQANGIDRAYGIDHVITTGGNCTAQGDCVYDNIQATLKAGGVHAVCFEPGAMVRDMGNRIWEGQSPTLRATMGDNQPAVCFDRATFNQGINAQYDFEVSQEGVVSTVVAKGPSGVCYGIGNGQADQTDLHEKMGALNCMHDQQAVCYDARGNGDGETLCGVTSGAQFTGNFEPTASTLRARGYKEPQAIVSKQNRKYIIRRLTPTECARLQGFPDWWSNLAPYNPADAEFWEDVRKTHAEINGKTYKPVKDIKKWYDKLHTDSAEYKMWGNGIALPNAEYVLRGISEQGAKTLGSLFDGSGGFPLAGVMNGIKPLWASEVEPYPIAVTKSRFKEVRNGWTKRTVTGNE